MTGRIGIIDWGIGGVGLYKRFRERSTAPVTYFSDTGALPYGKMSRSELSARLNAVIEFLKAGGVSHILIGCNAASTVLGDLVDHGLPIIGVIEPAVEAAAKEVPTMLGVIGGRRTIRSGIYRKAFTRRGIPVRQRVAQPLSALIESGDLSSITLRNEVRLILGPLRDCSHILLACTHYPAIRDILSEYAPRETGFIDPADAVVTRALGWRVDGPGSDLFLTTGGVAAMKQSARAAFEVTIPHAKRVAV